MIFDAFRMFDSLKNETKLSLDNVLRLSQKCLILINSKYENHIMYGLAYLIKMMEWIKRDNKLKTPRVLNLVETMTKNKRIAKIKVDNINKYSVSLLKII